MRAAHSFIIVSFTLQVPDSSCTTPISSLRCVCVCVCVWCLWTILLCIALMQCWFPYESLSAFIFRINLNVKNIHPFMLTFMYSVSMHHRFYLFWTCYFHPSRVRWRPLWLLVESHFSYIICCPVCRWLCNFTFKRQLANPSLTRATQHQEP